MQTSGSDHENKNSIVLGTHTIIDPHAVMIKFLYASIALLTMSRLICDISLAIIAI